MSLRTDKNISKQPYVARYIIKCDRFRWPQDSMEFLISELKIKDETRTRDETSVQ
jgi:hypothetical protein